MPRATKSQWDFGELFPPEATRRVWTVAELTTQIKRVLEKQVGQVWVNGEITNIRFQSSGHIYFSIKDADAQLSCVLFRGEAVSHRELLEDGRKVLLRGDLTVYEPRGQYQLRVTAVELQGVGALQAAFEKLKQKLKAEGLFETGRKRPLPRCPQRLGVVTSPTGAALRDVLHVVQRRNPALEIIVAPCRVQGDGAATEIAEAIRLLNAWGTENHLDLILVTRGGGSLEDLWAFNEEAVARAIFESRLPVVSAVGHEIDFTISDFVADLRAATPSAAAEIITEGVYASLQFLAGAGDRLRALARGRLEEQQDALEHCAQRLARLHPRRQINERWQRLDDAQTRLLRAASQGLRQARVTGENLSGRLARVRPRLWLLERARALEVPSARLRERTQRRLQLWQQRLAAAGDRLRLLSPEQILDRGYSITQDAATGRILRAAAEVRPGQKLVTRLNSGRVHSVATEP